MPRIDAHPRSVAAARAIDGKRTKFSVVGASGLILDCAPDGSRAWYARYQIGHGRTGRTRRYHRLGSFDSKAPDFLTLGQARDKAAALQTDAKRDGRDTFAEARIVTFGETLDDLIRAWVERHGKQHKRTWQRDLRRLELHIAPRIGAKLAKEVQRADVINLLDDVALKVGTTEANRVQAVLSAAFSWALDEGLVDTHPAFRLRKRGREQVSDRHLSDSELQRFWRALDTIPSNIADALRLLALLGQRLSEVSGMTLRELKLDNDSTWSLTAMRTKNKLPHVVPLPPLAAKIIQRQIPRGQFVFPSRLVVPQAIEGSTLSARFADLARELAFDPVGTVRHQKATLHTLRHTMKTNLAQLGVPDNISDRVTNQVTGQRSRVGSRYDHYTYLDEKRRALELWEHRLMEIVEGRPNSGLKW